MIAPLTLRGATEGDRDRLLAWRNDPDTRAASRHTEVVLAEAHSAWLQGVLADPDRQLLIAELDGVAVGQVRFDRVRGYRHEISASLDPAARGKGIGALLIAGACEWLWLATNASVVVAFVRDDNDASSRAFEWAGFRPVEAVEDGFVTLELVRPEPFAPERPSDRGRMLPFSR